MIKLAVMGDAELIKKLTSLDGESKKAVRKAARNSGKTIAKAARSLAPVDTGQLRKAIKVRAIKRNSRGYIGVRVANSDKDYTGKTYYGSFQEYGTKTITGKHYLQQAADDNKETALNEFITELKEVLR